MEDNLETFYHEVLFKYRLDFGGSVHMQVKLANHSVFAWGGPRLLEANRRDMKRGHGLQRQAGDLCQITFVQTHRNSTSRLLNDNDDA